MGTEKKGQVLRDRHGRVVGRAAGEAGDATDYRPNVKHKKLASGRPKFGKGEGNEGETGTQYGARLRAWKKAQASPTPTPTPTEGPSGSAAADELRRPRRP